MTERSSTALSRLSPSMLYDAGAPAVVIAIAHPSYAHGKVHDVWPRFPLPAVGKHGEVRVLTSLEVDIVGLLSAVAVQARVEEVIVDGNPLGDTIRARSTRRPRVEPAVAS